MGSLIKYSFMLKIKSKGYSLAQLNINILESPNRAIECHIQLLDLVYFALVPCFDLIPTLLFPSILFSL